MTNRTPLASSVSLARLGMLTALGLMSGAVNALTISPVLVEMSPLRRVVSITVTNPSESAVSFQAELLTWTQPDGGDRYEATADLVVVPPIAEIGAGASQIFRVAVRTPLGAHEQAYRLILEDVTAETAASPDSATVNIRVRHSLPVFVSAPGKPHAQARLGACINYVPATPAATGCVRLDNDGAKYAQVKSMTVDGAGWHKDLNASSRVLAGAWRQWTFDVPRELTGSLHVEAETSDGPMTFAWPIPVH